MSRTRIASLFVAVILLASAARAQTGLNGWNRDGQTWLVWNDNLTFSGVESISVFRSGSPITNLAELAAAERIGRLYPQDWKAGRLQASAPGATWTVPGSNGGNRVLGSNEGLFVYTPHAAGDEYFAVVKTENLLTGPFASTGPIAQTLDPIVPHRQHGGVDANHPYDVYAFWLDGRADHTSGVPGFPVMGSASCHGVAEVFAVFEPRTGLPQAPMPGVVFLHGGSGSYWTYRPSASAQKQIDLHVDNGLYVTPDEGLYVNYQGQVTAIGTRWFGTCFDYDRFLDVGVVPAPGTLVVNYAQRRLEWILDWLQGSRGVDPTRTAFAGLSNGGRGTHIFVRAHPERVSASLSFVMPAVFEASGGEAVMGDVALDLPTSLPGSPGTADVIEPFVPLSGLDRPFSRYVDGTNDTQALWTRKPLVYDALKAQRTGAAIYWDGRGHTAGSTAGWVGQHFNGSPKHGVEYLTRYRADQSFPAFHDVDHNLGVAGQQPDPGDPVLPANGNPWGTWGGWFEWDPASIVDSTSGWSCRLWLETAAAWPADNAPMSTARTSVTLRRLQSFATTPHEVLHVELALANAPFTVVFAGALQVGADGTITVPGLPFGAAPLVLSVSRVAAGGALVGYGTATAGCAGAPIIGGNQVPRIDTPGFAVVHGNAPPNAFGFTVFGAAPANTELLGVHVNVELLSPPAATLGVLSGALGNAQAPLAIPNAPALIGYQLFVQGAWLDGCGPSGLAASRGLAITIQP
ncbi:MAG: hypothetical protein KDE27_22375 [Planctomycetes bacterium]|nr:hypothetical protein [Planctomycetota bacterium]